MISLQTVPAFKTLLKWIKCILHKIMCQVTRQHYTTNTILCKQLIVIIVQRKQKLFGNAENLISFILFWIVTRYEMS